MSAAKSVEISHVERPDQSRGETLWGSDAIADAIRTLDIPFVALNPGASFRGLHDSLVNRLGNKAPQMLLCLHEESAVALAHGWAKVMDKPMLAIAHSTVGLMHASMCVFNTWCDRVPLVLLGATGPVDADKRRPWIDWIHTARDQGALVRGYTKWDDQPGSVPAAMEAVVRAHQIASTAPCGPTYVCLDVGLQESRIDAIPPMLDVSRYAAPNPGGLDAGTAEQIVALVRAAERPVILMGRVSRSEQAWARRVALAEGLNALVVTDTKIASAFPTRHRLYATHGAMTPSDATHALIAKADLVLSLDWVDLGGTLNTAFGKNQVSAKVISISPDQYIHGGWNMDYQALAPTDIYVATTPDAGVPALLDALQGKEPVRTWADDAAPLAWPALPRAGAGDVLSAADIADSLRNAVGGGKTCLIRHPFAWSGHFWDAEHPLDILGYDGGGGVGSGPGMAVGAALALKGSDRLPVAVIGDGDFLMGATALWTAVHYGIPLLVIVANNQAFYNDEIHQERMALQRDRPVANKWIGQRIASPEIDLAALARAQGCTGYGPIERRADLNNTLGEAVAQVRNGAVVVLDVRVQSGYGAEMTKTVGQAVE